jgi:polysaccharide pyruvyl transferase WcaK-like protein
MAVSRRSIKLGILAEDDSDVEVLRRVLAKIAPAKRFGTNRFVGHGCGKLKHKCRSWAAVLASRGCSVLIVLHDSDKQGSRAVKTAIEAQLKTMPVSVICNRDSCRRIGGMAADRSEGIEGNI